MAFKLKKFSVDRFNNDVNSSIDPEDKYSKWSGYRQSVKGFIAKAAKNINSRGRAAVFGAGALNDVDLNFLCSAFSEVVLSDVDEKSMLDGIARQKLGKSLESRIKTLQIDYSGAEKEGFFRSIEDLADKSVSAEKIAEYIAEALPDLKPQTEAIGELGTFDLIVSCPVYTQIVFSQIESFLRILHDCRRYEYDELNVILNAAYRSMPAVIEKYNDLLIENAEEDSVIVLITDIAEISGADSKLKYIRELVDGQEKKSVQIEKFISENGLELAQTGCEDLESKTVVLDSMYEMWPFNDNKEYLCILMACQRRGR